jgi:hypothetical protein
MVLSDSEDNDSFSGALREPPLLERSASFMSSIPTPQMRATSSSQAQSATDAAIAALRKDMAVSAANLVVLAARKHAKQQSFNEMEWVVDVGVVRSSSGGDGVSSMMTQDQVCGFPVACSLVHTTAFVTSTGALSLTPACACRRPPPCLGLRSCGCDVSGADGSHRVGVQECTVDGV